VRSSPPRTHPRGPHRRHVAGRSASSGRLDGRQRYRPPEARSRLSEV